MNTNENLNTNNKKSRKEYMKEYMRKRNIKIRGEPRAKLTDDQKKEKVKETNKKNYIKKRDVALEYARNRREKKTGITRIDRIKKIFNTLTNDEKQILKLD
jgi:hypothetical protein